MATRRKGRCLKWAKGRSRCLKRAKSASSGGRRRKRKGKRNCRFGVNKRTGRCLKNKRKRR